MARHSRALVLISALLVLLVSIALYRQAEWMTARAPWEDGRLSYIFLASMSAAFAGVLLWIAYSGDLSGWKGASLDGGLSFPLIAIALVVIGIRDDNGEALLAAIGAASLGLIFLAVLIWTRHTPFVDRRPVPRLVRVSFAIFVVGLVTAGSGLLLRADHIFPWPLKPESSVIFGLLFAGSAAYYAYGLARPVWSNAYGQLAAFLFYDLVLIVPFTRHFGDVQPAHQLSLVIYVAVLVYSGLLATYYLFINSQTRLWKRTERPGSIEGVSASTGVT